MVVRSIRLGTYDAGRPAAISRQGIVVALLTFAGLILRLAAARGDFWLDEIWTYRLIETVPSVWSIFVALPNDNNHLLNTAWLALLGPTASPLAARSASIVFGTLCVPVVAHLGGRRDTFIGLCAAAVVAFDGLFVQFSSEARGYSGMILAVLVAIDRLEAILDEPRCRAPLIVFGVAIAFGTLSHPTMIVASAVLGATAAARVLADKGLTRTSLDRIATIGLAIVCGTLPAAICLLASLVSGPLHTGLASPFTWPRFMRGAGRMAAFILGPPDGTASASVAMTVFAGLAVAGLAVVPGRRRIFPALAIFGVSALQIAFRVPNEEYARFHLLSGIGFLVLAIDVMAVAAKSGGAARAVGLAILLSAGICQAWSLARFLGDGRGAIAGPVAEMADAGPTEVMVRPAYLFGETGAVINWYAARLGLRLASVRPRCGASAPWLLVAREPDDTSVVPTEERLGAGCTDRFVLKRADPAYGLSGFTWLVYHRVHQAPALQVSALPRRSAQ